jgi:hypothetical protein
MGREKNINGNAKTSAKESLRLYELKQHNINYILINNLCIFLDKKSRLECSGYRIPTKAMQII